MSSDTNMSGMSEICELTDDELYSATGGEYVINVENLLSEFITGGWQGSSQFGGHGGSLPGWHGNH
jgi:hypothetical protein